jgi:calcineurin-like phosphoesterase family protein
MIYFTSDIHFGHESILRLCRRPFSTTEEMNETIIRNINRKVHKNDELYILGDFSFRSALRPEYYLEQIRCKNIRLILGNHDVEKECEKSGGFKWIKSYHEMNHNKTKLVLFHYPIFEWNGYHNNAIHLHGHTHNAEKERYHLIPQMGKRCINVGVDMNEFAPISMDEIFARVAE